MEHGSHIYQTYVRILERELVPAMGCTEPIAIAYCAAHARAVLGALPEAIHIEASGNIIKNVKSVVVPNTDGRRGIAAAAAAGALYGDETAQLEVISHVSPAQKALLPAYLDSTRITVRPAQSDYVLDITVTVSHGDAAAKVRAVHEHTNLVLVEKDGRILEQKEISSAADPDMPDYSLLDRKSVV